MNDGEETLMDNRFTSPAGPVMWIGRPKHGDSLARGVNVRTTFAQTAFQARSKLAVEMGLDPLTIEVEMLKA